MRSNDFDFRANLAYHVSSVLRNSLGAERAEKLQYQKYCRQAEEKLQRLVDAINQVRVWSSTVVPNQSMICIVIDTCVGQVRRTCPCGRHHYRARLNTEPAIVSVMAPIDAGSMSDGRTHPFTDVQAYQPASNTSAASFSPAAPLLRPRMYITDYFGKNAAPNSR